MHTYEYVAIPAPRKGVSSKGVKGVPDKFANAVTILMNEMAVEGWNYLRTDTLPCEERQGLTGKTVKYHAMLVFRRAIAQDAEEPAPLALPVPEEEDDDITVQEDTDEKDVEEHDAEVSDETIDEFPDEVDGDDAKEKPSDP